MKHLKHDRNNFLGDASGISKNRSSQSRPSTFGEAWQHSLLENTSDVIAVLEVDGTIRYASPAVERMLGYSPEEVIDTSVFYYVHPDDYERALAAFAETLERPGVLPTLEFRARRSDGTWRHVEVVRNNRLEDPTVLGVVIDVRDITERRRTEEALKESERRYATLLANAPAYLYRCRNEPAWPNEFVSDYAMELTGYSPEELTNGTVMFGDLIVEEDRERVWKEVQAGLAERQRFGLRYAIRRRDGEIRHVEEHGQGVYGEDGRVVALEGVVYDVTERKLAEERLGEAEERYRTLVEQIPAVTYIDSANNPDTSLYTSPQIERMLGYTPEEWLENKLWPKRLHPDDRERVLAADERFEAGGEPFSEEYRMIAKSGAVVWVREEAVAVRDKVGRPLYWQGVILDVTERKEAEEAVRRSEASLAESQRMAHLGTWEWDVKTSEVWWSDETFRIYGFEPEGLVPRFEKLLEVVHPEDQDLLREAIGAALYERKPYDFEHRIVRPSGEVRWVHRQGEVVRGGGGEPLRMIGTVHDITERKALEEQLEHQAFYDSLTDQPNRRLVVDRLGHALGRTRRKKGRQVAIFFMDLDDFKIINDSVGHDIGDRVLVAVSERLKEGLRPEDTLARFGGDEFVVMLEDAEGPEEVVRVAERITDTLREPILIDGRELFVRASIGIALGYICQKSSEELLRDADTAMYRAKDEGLNYKVFDEAMYEQAIDRLELENDLSRVIEQE